MTLPNELHPGFFFAGGGADLGDTIEESLRFNGSQYLYRNATTPTDATKFTLSFWMKRGKNNSAYQTVMYAGVDAQNKNDALWFYPYAIELNQRRSNVDYQTTTNALFRDPTAWYHVVYTWSSGTRVIYVNGVNQSFSRNNTTTSTHYWQTNGRTIEIGRDTNNGGSPANYSEFYLAAYHFIDGQALNATDFGKYNTDGVWVPQDYTGTHGDNGFYLKFDSSGYNGSGGIGADHSGNGNNFTATGFDTSSIVSYNDDVYGDTSTTYDNTNTNKVFLNSGQYGPSRMFDGDLVNDACKSGTGQAQTWIYWRPSGGLSISSSLVVHCSNTADVRINGTSTGQTNGGSLSDFPITIASPPSTLTELAIQGNSISSATIYGVVVDGVTLVNNTDTDVDYNDTPTSNYSTLNPLNTKVYSTTRISNANLRISGTATNAYIDAQSTQAASEFDCYCEATVIAQDLNGIGVGDITAAIASGAGSYVTYRENGAVIQYPGNTTLATVASYDTGDVLGMTATSTQVAFYKNGTLQGTYTHNLTGEFFAIGMAYNTGATSTMDFNFGQMPFLYTVPTGFKALQTNNLTEPTIKDARDHFEPVLWSGNDVDDRNITTTNGFAPDLVWIKSRSTGNHGLFDTIRGATKRIMSNYSNAEDTQANDLQAFNTDGFQVGTQARVNASGQNYVAWCWKAGETFTPSQTGGITNLAGSRNTDAGFSIVKYTGSNSAATIGHGLNSAPEMIIIKNRTDNANWIVYHKDINPAGAPEDWYLMLHVEDQRTLAGDAWGSTAPTASVFHVGAFNNTNGDGDNLIAYCWHSVENYSKFGKYTGAGSGSSPNADGPYIFLGFKPALVIIKRTDSNSGGEWSMYDSSRSTANPNRAVMIANNNTVETTMDGLDLLSNGFKVRGGNGTWVNVTGGSYVYMAWAESPFGGENVPPATAR